MQLDGIKKGQFTFKKLFKFKNPNQNQKEKVKQTNKNHKIPRIEPDNKGTGLIIEFIREYKEIGIRGETQKDIIKVPIMSKFIHLISISIDTLKADAAAHLEEECIKMAKNSVQKIKARFCGKDKTLGKQTVQLL